MEFRPPRERKTAANPITVTQVAKEPPQTRVETELRTVTVEKPILSTKANTYTGEPPQAMKPATEKPIERVTS
ncbi:hypothetical protein TWF718_000404 [Orbilia javanica]|uniref:Uncharacterized protein n=1 Tax=Orbilia javanica TaxID=47235 RepID=A0AAN8N7Z3_9PEZI